MAYTYVINCPDGRRYYGVRYSKNCKETDMWVTYFTSSKEIKRMIDLYGKESFSFEIRKTFDDPIKARLWESKVLRRLHVRSNNNWVNKNDNRSIPPLYGDDNPSKRIEVREKISKSKTGKSRPDQSERLLNNHHMKTEKSRKKLSETKKEQFKNGQLTHFYKGKKRPEISGENHPRYGKKFQKLSDMNSVEHTCPFCNKVGKGPGMKRYHFDNCKISTRNDS